MPAMKLVYGYRIKPARFEDWRALNREGDKIVQRLGGHNIRALTPMAAGPESSVQYSTIDFVDGEHLGMFLDAAGRDLESQTFLDRLAGHNDSPTEMLYSATITEIDLGAPKAHGTVMDVWVSKLRPGRFDDAMGFVNETVPRVVDSGAVGVHLYTVDAAGTESGRSVWTAEYENFEAYGRSIDRVAGDKDLREMSLRVQSGDTPFEIVQHSLMREIPLH
jgi:hypothetical protein